VTEVAEPTAGIPRAGTAQFRPKISGGGFESLLAEDDGRGLTEGAGQTPTAAAAARDDPCASAMAENPASGESTEDDVIAASAEPFVTVASLLLAGLPDAAATTPATASPAATSAPALPVPSMGAAPEPETQIVSSSEPRPETPDGDEAGTGESAGEDSPDATAAMPTPAGGNGAVGPTAAAGAIARVARADGPDGTVATGHDQASRGTVVAPAPAAHSDEQSLVESVAGRRPENPAATPTSAPNPTQTAAFRPGAEDSILDAMMSLAERGAAEAPTSPSVDGSVRATGTAGDVLTRPPGEFLRATAPAERVEAARTSERMPLHDLAVEIAASAREGRRRFEIRLDPPELGRIEVSLAIDPDGRVSSRLVVERADTYDMLRRDAPALERALASAGIKTEGHTLEFALRDHGLTREQRFEPPRYANRPADRTDDAAVFTGPLPNHARGRLDIRV
jgi:flagellar hook-length control protein FliK